MNTHLQAERKIQAQALTTTLEEVAFLAATQTPHSKNFIKYQRNTAIQVSIFWEFRFVLLCDNYYHVETTSWV